jgi:CRP-like cAMP-binding protein
MEEKLRSHIEKITPLTNDEFSLVRTLFTIQSFKKNQFLIHQNQRVNNAYFIESGLLKLTFTDDLGKIHIVSFAMEDWWESDFQAYFNQSKATMNLRCIENTTVLSLSYDNYNKMCVEVPKMQTYLIKMSNSGFIASQQRILSLLTNNATERYEKFCNQYPSLIQRVPKSQIALYLGVSRETLSRLVY